jgi:hypothetical protein
MNTTAKWLWWNDVLKALPGEAEITYNPKWQEVPAGMFDTHSHTVQVQVGWENGDVWVESFVDDDTLYRHKGIRLPMSTSPKKAAAAIRAEWP